MVSITIVDDSPVDRMLAAGLLQSNPLYEIDLAENGIDALRRLEDKVPDLVVTDLMMPVTLSWLTPATVAHMPSPLPKVMAPRHISETIRPVFPNFL